MSWKPRIPIVTRTKLTHTLHAILPHIVIYHNIFKDEITVNTRNIRKIALKIFEKRVPAYAESVDTVFFVALLAVVQTE